MIGRKPPVSPDSALASDVFDQLCAAGTLKGILHHHRHLCEVLKIKPTNFPHFYPKLRTKINNWRAQALWSKFDKRASLKCYNRGKACSQTKVLIIGAGPCGLRAAIEAQLLGARVVVVEKRDRITRNNVLHLWPYVIHDLKGLGAKKLFGKFCAGSIDHISIRQLQCMLLKVALILGVEIHEGVSFDGLLPPLAEQQKEKIGWRAIVTPSDHPVSQFEFDVLIGADGKRNTLEGFKRKEFRGKLAIAITANFINRRTEAEARVEEISGVAFIFNQKFFKDLYADTRIDLENIVYYKDDTHYFVMTAKKHSLIDKGVILQDYADTARLLDPANVDKEALLKYAKEAADFSTNYMLPDLDFAVNHYGQPDVAMFDFTSMYAAENASRVVERNGHKLLQLLVGDSLLEPFWPTGSGCARGFLSSMDACWAIRSWATEGTLSPLDVVAERESIYRLLGQTTPENLQKDLQSYTLDPHSRYPNLNIRSVVPFQVKNLFETDDPLSMELALTPVPAAEMPKKRRRKDSQVHPDTLLLWLKRQVCLHSDLHVTDVTSSFRSGLVLCAIIHRYRPDLLDFASLDPCDVAVNNQRAFDILEKELGILPVMTGEEMASCECPDRLSMLSYLSQVYDAFRGEIPHTKQPRLQADLEEEPAAAPVRMVAVRKRASPQHKDTPSRKNRKRRSGNDKPTFGGDREARLRAEIRNKLAEGEEADENFSGRIRELEEKLKGGNVTMQKKPRDLLRAIGKIEKTDWQVKEIERKMEENRYGRSGIHDRAEKVPKWSKQQFEDKFQAVERKLAKKGLDAETATRYAEVDVTLRRLEQKLKEGSTLETGQRGSNKVAAMADHFTPKPEPQIPLAKSGSKGALALASSSTSNSDVCHFCDKRVYLMERVSAEGKFFHRSCFRCEYCGTSLRVGSYMFDGEGRYGFRFYCNQHYRFPGTIKQRQLDQQKKHLKSPQTPLGKDLGVPHPAFDRGATPERIEFENLAEDAIDAESEMDEDEWTDRNFGASAAEASSDDVLDLDESDESDDDAEEEALMTADETREVAKRWTRKHSSRSGGFAGGENNGQDSCEADDSDDMDDCSPGDESDTATDGEEEQRLRELRKQEVRVLPARNVPDTDTGSDTEVASDERTCTDVENSATEISTDSEFEHDGTTPTRSEVPDILTAHRRRRPDEQPKKVQVKSGRIEAGKGGVQLEFRPLVETKNNFNSVLVRPTPLINPRRGDYLLSKTQSTEGIATKISLELRRKYLLGGSNAAHPVTKSATATALDPSSLRNFASSITECQKLLNPSPEIPPTMQALLQPTPLPSLNLLRQSKQLPSPTSSFVHVCGRPDNDNLENTDPNVQDIANKNAQVAPNDNAKKGEEDLDCRPRSPVHETSILVPQIPWSNSNEKSNESESESESESSGSGSDDEAADLDREENKLAPPRLEIRDSHGQLLMEEDNFEMDSLQPCDDSHSAMSMAAQIELARCKIDELKNSIAKGENAIQGALVRDSPQDMDSLSTEHSRINWPLDSGMQPDSIIEPQRPDEIALDSIEPTTGLFDSIDPLRSTSPQSGDDSCRTFPANTETEFSDWARDGDLEICDDLEDDGDKSKAQKPKSLSLNKGFPHVCGQLLASAENLDLMDTDPSFSEAPPPPGYTLLSAETEVTPTRPPTSSSSGSSTSESRDNQPALPVTTEESTASEPTTVKNISAGSDEKRDTVCYWPLEDMSPLSPPSDKYSMRDTAEREQFAQYVHTLQGRISPFHNARDSIDYRKSKQKVDTNPTVGETIKEEITSPTNANELSKPTDPTSQKLLEISRERSIQKSLVHEMVLNKVLAAKKSPSDRKGKRVLKSSSGILNKSNSPTQVPSESPAPPPVPHDDDDVFKTPIAPPRDRRADLASVERDRIRESARARARLKSDEELGLSPEDKIKAIKEKAREILDTPKKSTQENSELTRRIKNNRNNRVLKSSSTSTLFDKLRSVTGGEGSSMSTVAQKSTSDLLAAPESPEPSTSSSSTAKNGPHRARDGERRKSIIQAVSDFFHKKSTSPTKSPTAHSPTKAPSPTKFDKFTGKMKLTAKPKDKKDVFGSTDKISLSPSASAVSSLQTTKPSGSTSYQVSPTSEESGSEMDGTSGLSQSSPVQNPAAPAQEDQRARMTKRMARQAQLKRLRMAQEIQRRLEEVEEKQRELEDRGVRIEKALRGEGDDGASGHESTDLLRDWFELVHERNELRRYERELTVRAKEIELEDRHARLQLDLRERLSKDDSSKTYEDVLQEGVILREMLETVEKRDELTRLLEEDRQRFQEEEKDLEAQVLAKGLRLTPLNKYQYQSTV